jgi:hypothetical protein
MRYTDSNGKDIKNITDWRFIFLSSNKEKHWKVGRSAETLADFMLHGNGESFIKEIVAEVLKEDVSFEKTVPESRMKFDDYGKQREHDLAIRGTSHSQKEIFIGVEAKVDEPFGKTIGEAYLSAKTKELNGKGTNAPKRIEQLLKRFFPELKKKYFNLRYQLFYAAAGTLGAETDISILLILVFKTDSYDERKADKNHNDYIQFMDSLNAKRIESSRGYLDIRSLQIGERPLYSIFVTIDRDMNGIPPGNYTFDAKQKRNDF